MNDKICSNQTHDGKHVLCNCGSGWLECGFHKVNSATSVVFCNLGEKFSKDSLKNADIELTIKYLQHVNRQGGVVCKRSGKPFKSKSPTNTVWDVVLMDDLTEKLGKNVYGFSFMEDDSIVECWRCVPQVAAND